MRAWRVLWAGKSRRRAGQRGTQALAEVAFQSGGAGDQGRERQRLGHGASPAGRRIEQFVQRRPDLVPVDFVRRVVDQGNGHLRGRVLEVEPAGAEHAAADLEFVDHLEDPVGVGLVDNVVVAIGLGRIGRQVQARPAGPVQVVVQARGRNYEGPDGGGVLRDAVDMLR